MAIKRQFIQLDAGGSHLRRSNVMPGPSMAEILQGVNYDERTVIKVPMGNRTTPKGTGIKQVSRIPEMVPQPVIRTPGWNPGAAVRGEKLSDWIIPSIENKRRPAVPVQQIAVPKRQVRIRAAGKLTCRPDPHKLTKKEVPVWPLTLVV